ADLVAILRECTRREQIIVVPGQHKGDHLARTTGSAPRAVLGALLRYTAHVEPPIRFHHAPGCTASAGASVYARTSSAATCSQRCASARSPSRRAHSASASAWV